MKLTHNCPKCGKVAKIQSEFPMGSLINYVYQCGHLELRTKIPESNETLNVINQLEASLKEINKAKSNPEPQVALLNSEVKQPEIKSPEPTFKELYEDLENWVNEGGRTKGVNEPEIPPYIHPSFRSVDYSKCAYEFQREGIQFAEKSELNCLIADAMGLGKTIQGLVAIKRNKTIAMPCLAIVKGATLFQWANEFQKWVSAQFTSCMPITNRAHIIPGFDFYILSMDMLSKQDVIDKLLKLNLKCVIIDEVQNFKDPDAKRTHGLIKLIKFGDIKFKLALSGTPIKNRANEYFTILNILAPTYFDSYDSFKKQWLLPEERRTNSGNITTVYNRLNPLHAEKFKELTSRWIIRRERVDVLKNLPPLTRDYQIIEIDDQNIKNSYNRTVDLFKNFLNDTKSGANSSQLLGWLAQLRAITGQAKCKAAIEWTKDFLESTEESLAIGIQHHSVRDTLYYVLENSGISCLKLSGEDNVYRKSDIVRQFTAGSSRVLVINSLAGGVGLNLQTCAQALVLERQWNSADEEQFEARFHRDGQQRAVTITYMIAKGTIDEFFHEMVTKKRQILIETGIGNQVDLTIDLNFLQELCEQVSSHKI